jgi:hypothetical protein
MGTLPCRPYGTRVRLKAGFDLSGYTGDCAGACITAH